MRAICTLAALAMMAFGCVNNPGDGKHLASKSTQFNHNGYVNSGQSGYRVCAYASPTSTGTFSLYATGTASSTLMSDPYSSLTGYAYSFNGTVGGSQWSCLLPLVGKARTFIKLQSTARWRCARNYSSLQYDLPFIYPDGTDFLACFSAAGQVGSMPAQCGSAGGVISLTATDSWCYAPPGCEHADGEPCTKISQSCPDSGVLTGEWVCNEWTGNNTCNVECPPPECEHADGEPCMGVPGDCPSNVVVTGEWVCNESTGQNTCNLPGPGAANGYCVSGLDPSDAPGCPSPFGSLCTRDSDCQPGLKCEVDFYSGGTRVICRQRPQPYYCNVPFCWLYSQQSSVCP